MYKYKTGEILIDTKESTTVTYLPVVYSTSVDEESGMQVQTPNAPLSHFKKHVAEMAEQGWTLVSVESLPRIKYNEAVAFSEVIGYLLFWQRPPVAEHTAPAEPMAGKQASAGLDAGEARQQETPGVCARGETGQEEGNKDKEYKDEDKNKDKNNGKEHHQKKDDGRPSDATGVDLNKKYQVSKQVAKQIAKIRFAEPVPRSADEAVDGSGRTIHKKLQPVPSTGTLGFAPAPDDATSDFNPDDPLVQEVRSLRHAVAHRGYIVDPSARDNVQLDDPE